MQTNITANVIYKSDCSSVPFDLNDAQTPEEAIQEVLNHYNDEKAVLYGSNQDFEHTRTIKENEWDTYYVVEGNITDQMKDEEESSTDLVEIWIHVETDEA